MKDPLFPHYQMTWWLYIIMSQFKKKNMVKNNFAVSFWVVLYYSSDLLASNIFVDVKLRNIAFPFQAIL